MGDELRSLSDVSDDEIMAAIARRGMLGIDLDDTSPNNEIEKICIELALLEKGEEDEGRRDAATLPLMDRIHGMCTGEDNARLAIPISNRLMLTPLEWGMRLEGKFPDEIAEELQGTCLWWEDGVVDTMYVDPKKD